MLFIAEKCDLTLKRTERAAADLVKSGLITVYPLCEKLSDTIYKGYAAIRTISTKLFTIFGMGGRLKFERDRAADRQRKRLKKEDTKSKAKVDLLITAKLQDHSEQKPTSGGRTAELKAIKAILSG